MDENESRSVAEQNPEVPVAEVEPTANATTEDSPESINQVTAGLTSVAGTENTTSQEQGDYMKRLLEETGNAPSAKTPDSTSQTEHITGPLSMEPEAAVKAVMGENGTTSGAATPIEPAETPKTTELPPSSHIQWAKLGIPRDRGGEPDYRSVTAINEIQTAQDNIYNEQLALRQNTQISEDERGSRISALEQQSQQLYEQFARTNRPLVEAMAIAPTADSDFIATSYTQALDRVKAQEAAQAQPEQNGQADQFTEFYRGLGLSGDLPAMTNPDIQRRVNESLTQWDNANPLRPQLEGETDEHYQSITNLREQDRQGAGRREFFLAQMENNNTETPIASTTKPASSETEQPALEGVDQESTPQAAESEQKTNPIPERAAVKYQQAETLRTQANELHRQADQLRREGKFAEAVRVRHEAEAKEEKAARLGKSADKDVEKHNENAGREAEWTERKRQLNEGEQAAVVMDYLKRTGMTINRENMPEAMMEAAKMMKNDLETQRKRLTKKQWNLLNAILKLILGLAQVAMGTTKDIATHVAEKSGIAQAALEKKKTR